MKKPFKIKNPYPVNRKGKINPNSEGNTDTKDGRSKSSAFQDYKSGYYGEGKSNKKPAAPKMFGSIGSAMGTLNKAGINPTMGAAGMIGKMPILMGFKLGKSRGNYAVNGEIRNKMRFGNQAGDADASVPGTPVIRTSLGPGIRGEANMDGTIYISDLIEPGSDEEREVINHEMRHATDIKIGKLAYDDDHVMYNGERFERDYVIDENGDVIDAILVEGEWKEVGSHDFPWESDANNGS